MLQIGLISDTHGLLRPEAVAALRGSDYIVHAGDIGDPAILRQLAELAPVTAVRGNNDRGEDYAAVPETAVLQAGAARLYVIHDLKELAVHPQAGGVDAVISGHSHRPRIERRGGVLYVNPGSAGPRRFSLPISAARLRLDGGRLEAELIELVLSSRARKQRAGREGG